MTGLDSSVVPIPPFRVATGFAVAIVACAASTVACASHNSGGVSVAGVQGLGHATSPDATSPELHLTSAVIALLCCAAAASSVSTKAKKPKGGAGGASTSLPSAVAIDPHTPSQYITRPPSEAELAEWKRAISGKDAWSGEPLCTPRPLVPILVRKCEWYVVQP